MKYLRTLLIKCNTSFSFFPNSVRVCNRNNQSKYVINVPLQLYPCTAAGDFFLAVTFISIYLGENGKTFNIVESTGNNPETFQNRDES